MTDSETRRLRFDGLFAAYAPDTAVTVGGDGIIRKIAVTWGTWSYTVTYDGADRPRHSLRLRTPAHWRS